MKMGGSSSPLIYRSLRFHDKFSPCQYKSMDEILCYMYSNDKMKMPSCIIRQKMKGIGVFMLPFFNQKELVVCSNQSQYQKYTSLLEKAGISYRTKARDLSSPSLFSMGTRERAGTAFQKVNYQTLYTIYVRKADYERAVHVIIV